MANLLQLSKTGGITLQGHNLHVIPLESEYPEYTCGLKIENIPPETTDQMLRVLFESQELGGGPIVDIYRETADGRAIVAYHKTEGK